MVLDLLVGVLVANLLVVLLTQLFILFLKVILVFMELLERPDHLLHLSFSLQDDLTLLLYFS